MSSIIKAAQAPTSSQHGIQSVAFNFVDMASQADQYLNKVRQQAGQIIARAKHEAEKVRQEAQKQGREAALAAAEKTLQEKLAKQMKTVLPALNQVVEEIRGSRDAWIRQWEANVVHLASAIAARIIRREISQSPEIAIDWIKEALRLAAGSGTIKLHLNPKDHEALREQVETVAEEMGKLTPTDVIPDANITPGGCRVVTQFGSIDQQIESQLARIEQELT